MCALLRILSIRKALAHLRIDQNDLSIQWLGTLLETYLNLRAEHGIFVQGYSILIVRFDMAIHSLEALTKDN